MFTLTPTKYALELSSTRLMLKVYAPNTQHGYAVIEAVPFADGVGPKPATLASMRKHGAKMAKRWNVPFEDRTLVRCDTPMAAQSRIEGRRVRRAPDDRR